jgi:protein tyrosine phosphatase
MTFCSAGIGRTGTFLAIHMNRQKALRREKIDVMETVLDLVLRTRNKLTNTRIEKATNWNGTK